VSVSEGGMQLSLERFAGVPYYEDMSEDDLTDISRTHSMITSAAMVSTIGTARGTTHGSCRPFAARTPDDPSYRAVGCSCEIVAGGLKPILRTCSSFTNLREPMICSPEIDVLAI